MKKIITTICLAAALCGSANAQSILDLLKGKKSSDTTTESTTQSSAASAAGSILGGILNSVVSTVSGVDISGNWSYKGSAVALESDNTLTNLAGTAATTQLEGKIDQKIAKFGIKPGSMGFNFANDGTFTCTIGKITLNGTWTIEKDGSELVMKYGKVMNYLTMEGVAKTTTDGCEILFEANKFLGFVKNAIKSLGKNGDATVATVGTLLENYDRMKVGFRLVKAK